MSLEQIRHLLKGHEVNVEYVKPLPKYTAEKPYILGLDIALSDELIRTNLEFERKQLNVSDARSVRDELSVEAQGFELLTIPSEIMALHFNDINSRNETKGVQSLLSQRFNTDKVYLYDHAVRCSSSSPCLLPLTLLSIEKRRAKPKKKDTPSRIALTMQSLFEIHTLVRNHHSLRV